MLVKPLISDGLWPLMFEISGAGGLVIGRCVFRWPSLAVKAGHSLSERLAVRGVAVVPRCHMGLSVVGALAFGLLSLCHWMRCGALDRGVGYTGGCCCMGPGSRP